MIKKLLIKMIRTYQSIPFRCHNNCKYIPSCSNYAIDAIEYKGAFIGSLMAIWRILRCNPFSKGGIDEVKKSK